MTLNITIKQKLTGFALIALVLLLGVGYSGYWGVRQLNQAMQVAVLDFSALRNHMESDMMHDALRADVYVALHAGPQASTADKQAIRDAVEHLFEVKVVRVNTQNRRGKPRRTRTRVGETKAWKKAIVTLDPEHRINFF